MTSADFSALVDTFSDVDTTIIKEVLYFDGWTSYEECGGFLIFVGVDDSIQKADYGTSVFAEDNTQYFRPYVITREEADREIAEMKYYLQYEHTWPS